MNKSEKERIVKGFLKFGFEKKMINDDIISNLIIYDNVDIAPLTTSKPLIQSSL